MRLQELAAYSADTVPSSKTPCQPAAAAQVPNLELRTNFALFDAVSQLLQALYWTEDYAPEFIRLVMQALQSEADFLANADDPVPPEWICKCKH